MKLECLRPLQPHHDGWMAEMKYLGVDTAERPGADRCLATVNEKPIGLVDYWETACLIEPHIDWHPWATVREKYQAFMAGMRDFGKMKNVMMMCRESEKDFFEMWAKRGIIRKVGFLENIQEEDVMNIHIYQLRRERVG